MGWGTPAAVHGLLPPLLLPLLLLLLLLHVAVASAGDAVVVVELTSGRHSS